MIRCRNSPLAGTEPAIGKFSGCIVTNLGRCPLMRVVPWTLCGQKHVVGLWPDHPPLFRLISVRNVHLS